MDSRIKKLRQQSHGLNPVVTIGAKGLTDNVHQEIDGALVAHELIKVRCAGSDRSQQTELIQAICHRHQAELVNHIGHVIVLYRQNPDD